MDLKTIIETLDLTLLTDERDFSDIHIDSAYMSDLLSCVMTGAKPHGVWVTLIANINIVAVASLLRFLPSSSLKMPNRTWKPLNVPIGKRLFCFRQKKVRTMYPVTFGI